MTELAVLVPVLDRPQNVQPLIDSFNTSDAPGELWFIATATDTDELEALDKAGANYLTTYAVTYPQKNNLAVRAIDADWYFLGADDISFPEGWWTGIVQYINQADRPQVIGTSDGGNARTTQQGMHSTHTAVSRKYVERGSIDADDFLCAFYHHWCVDDEFIWTARTRGTYSHSGVLVPCRHPYWQTAEMDDTYRRGEAHAAEDMALWKQRAKDLLGLDVN